MTEIGEMATYSSNIQSQKKKINRKKEKEWKNDIQKQVDINNKRSKRLTLKFRKNLPESAFSRLVIKSITQFIGNKYKRKIKKVLATINRNMSGLQDQAIIPC